MGKKVQITTVFLSVIVIKHIYIHIFIYMVFYMDRKLHNINGSLVITLPKQICDLYNFQPGDNINIETIGYGELRLKKSPNR